MTCQSLFGVAEGEAEGLAADFEDDFEDDFDLAKEVDPSPRQTTPATKRKRSRGAFIIKRGAG